MIYGHNKTIHRTGTIDIQMTKTGQVVAVWFRCLSLPFRVSTVEDHEYQPLLERELPRIRAIDVDLNDTLDTETNEPRKGWWSRAVDYLDSLGNIQDDDLRRAPKNLVLPKPTAAPKAQR
jgi:hypothetical protein